MYNPIMNFDNERASLNTGATGLGILQIVGVGILASLIYKVD